MAKVLIPTTIQRHVVNQTEVRIEGSTVGEVLNNLKSKYPGIEGVLFREGGKLNKYVNIFVSEEDIRFLKNLDTPVKDGDVVSIIPAISGGTI